MLAICMGLILPYSWAQHIWVSHDAQVSFYSSTPVEDIEGISKSANSALNITTGEIIFKVKNTSFAFQKKMMQEHFNEDYMESHRYPVSEFKGKIAEVEQLKQQGSHDVVVKGVLQVHGVSKPYATHATVVVKDGVIAASANFKVKTADHQIKVPSIVVANIAEELMVQVSAVYRSN